MDLDLEHFWKVVRQKRHSPRPTLAPKPKTIRVHLEAVESAHGARCTSMVKIDLSKVDDGYRWEGRFGGFSRHLTVTGFRLYSRPGETAIFIKCEPQHLSPFDLLTLDLYIERGGEIWRQLQSKGLNLD